MGGELQEVVLLDVTPHNIGVRVAGDRMSVVIPRNTSIPTRAKKVFATTEDNQDFVAIEVYQGEHELASTEPAARPVRARRPAARRRAAQSRSRSASRWTPTAS